MSKFEGEPPFDQAPKRSKFPRINSVLKKSLRTMSAPEVRELNIPGVFPIDTIKNEYDVTVWFQTSRRYRSISRLPEGMTAREALQWAATEYNKIFSHPTQCNEEYGDERTNRRMFLRTYTDYPFAKHLTTDLSIEQFRAFRDAGGQAA